MKANSEREREKTNLNEKPGHRVRGLDVAPLVEDEGFAGALRQCGQSSSAGVGSAAIGMIGGGGGGSDKIGVVWRGLRAAHL